MELGGRILVRTVVSPKASITMTLCTLGILG